MNSINFTAGFIQKKQILKKEQDENYKPCYVSIVELDKTDKKDINALEKTALNWIMQGKGLITYNIYKNATKKYGNDNILKEHYLAVTTQNSDYENLDYSKILGVSLFSETDTPVNELNLLEVQPRTSSISKNREYKKVGTELLNYIQNTYNEKPIYVVSLDGAIDFYLKNNFKSISGQPDSHYLMYDV